MECPKCHNVWIKKRGFRKLKRGKVQVYQCAKGKHIFTLSRTRPQKITDDIKQKTIRLWHTYKPKINKFDAFRKTTYSTREIARLTGISYSAVAKILKNEA